jgi:hypothetical protein
VHELTLGEMPSVIFGRNENRRHGNFHPASYRNIYANPAWARRLRKVHHLAQVLLNEQTAMDGTRLRQQLGRAADEYFLPPAHGCEPGLGYMPGIAPGIPLRNGRTDRTEIDRKLGELLVEAKLTEAGFQKAPARMIERYRDIDEVFGFRELRKSGDVVFGCQLIRGVLAAHATGGSFCVLCDARRPGLIEGLAFGYARRQELRLTDRQTQAHDHTVLLEPNTENSGKQRIW